MVRTSSKKIILHDLIQLISLQKDLVKKEIYYINSHKTNLFNEHDRISLFHRMNFFEQKFHSSFNRFEHDLDRLIKSSKFSLIDSNLFVSLRFNLVGQLKKLHNELYGSLFKKGTLSKLMFSNVDNSSLLKELDLVVNSILQPIYQELNQFLSGLKKIEEKILFIEKLAHEEKGTTSKHEGYISYYHATKSFYGSLLNKSKDGFWLCTSEKAALFAFEERGGDSSSARIIILKMPISLSKQVVSSRNYDNLPFDYYVISEQYISVVNREIEKGVVFLEK